MVGRVTSSVAWELASVNFDLPVPCVTFTYCLEIALVSLTIVGELVRCNEFSFGRSMRSYDTVPYIFVTRSLLSL